MGCNCKALNHVVRTKKYYGFEKPTKNNVNIANKLKMVLQAILIWFILILLCPIFIVVIIFSKIFNKDIKFLKKIRIRI